MRNVAMLGGGMTRFAKYEDRAISGTTRARPGLQQLLAEVERTKGKAFSGVSGRFSARAVPAPRPRATPRPHGRARR